MKRVKAMNGYTIYQNTKRDVAEGYTEGEYTIYFSSDIKDYGRECSYPEYDGIGSMEEAEACCSGNYAKAREICEAECTCVTFEDIEKVEALLDSGMTREEIEEREDESMSYDYRKVMKKDIEEYIDENINSGDYENIEELRDHLEEHLWVADSVTGNASGSYTFNRWQAEAMVKDNLKLCIEALVEFGYSAREFGEKVADEEWEYLDVTIRCYLLGEVLAEVLDDMANELVFAE